MLKFKEVVYVDAVPKGIRAYLVGDIGGTNCNFGIFKKVDDKPTMLLSIHFKSQEITRFTDVVKQLLT